MLPSARLDLHPCLALDLRRGLEVLYRQMPLIAGELVYAAALVAEKLGVPWVALILSPFSFISGGRALRSKKPLSVWESWEPDTDQTLCADCAGNGSGESVNLYSKTSSPCISCRRCSYRALLRFNQDFCTKEILPKSGVQKAVGRNSSAGVTFATSAICCLIANPDVQKDRPFDRFQRAGVWNDVNCWLFGKAIAAVTGGGLYQT